MASTVTLITLGHSKSKDEPASTGSRISDKLDGRKHALASSSAVIVHSWGSVTYKTAMGMLRGDLNKRLVVVERRECVWCVVRARKRRSTSHRSFASAVDKIRIGGYSRRLAFRRAMPACTVCTAGKPGLIRRAGRLERTHGAL